MVRPSNQKRILAYTSPAIGHLYPMMPLLLELQSRGHELHVRTCSSELEKVRATGMSAEAVDPRILPVLGKHPNPEPGNTKQLLSTIVGVMTDRAVIDGPDLKRAIAEVEPDLLIIDTNCWGALCAAEAQHRPWVHFAPYLVPLKSRGTPPFGPGLPRWNNPIGWARDAIVRRFTFTAIERASMPVMNGLRAVHGLAPVPNFNTQMLDAPRLLITSAEPFDYPHPDWPDQVRRIGALFWEPPGEVPDWIAEIPQPITLVTTSSEYQEDENLARIAIEALADEPGSVVITMPAGIPDDLPARPPNIRIERFVPHLPLLERAAVAVTHGGMGATQKALAMGVPVCVVPFGRDQFETAARVVHADAGVRLHNDKLTPERLREAVRRAATKGPGAQRCAEGYRRAGGTGAGADAVEELLRS